MNRLHLCVSREGDEEETSVRGVGYQSFVCLVLFDWLAWHSFSLYRALSLSLALSLCWSDSLNRSLAEGAAVHSPTHDIYTAAGSEQAPTQTDMPNPKENKGSCLQSEDCFSTSHL